MMQKAIARMLERYKLQTIDDAICALREIIQEIALLGLWRARFFEHAAFYGGTALRIMYGLDRFSEDLDFTLLETKPDFNFGRFISIVEEEINAFGFSVQSTIREKVVSSPVQSAFLKANTRKELLVIDVPANIVKSIARDQKLKVKLEVDTIPPPGFNTSVKYLLHPIPFSVRVCDLPDLFAGKMHAILFRRWKNRIKGRDWYDFVWFAANHPELSLPHLEQRMRQTMHWEGDTPLSEKNFREILDARINSLDVNQASREVRPFLKQPEVTGVWSREFFHDIANRITCTKDK
jgi:predicted nucleotidyltransferase component of viral defense system